MMVYVVGILATFIACLLLYLASANQTLRRVPLPARLARASALLLMASALACLLARMHTLAAVLCFATLLMLFFLVLPYIGAQRQRMTARRRSTP